MPLVEDENELLAAFRKGESIIANCCIGFMVKVSETDDGKAKLECPVEAYEIRGPAEAEYVRQALVSWGDALALYDSKKSKLN